ncbi:homeobox-leucine zipper protein ANTHOCYANINLESS 2-like [Lycium barbarum]|uniref:homeobox-leucine zipper protein ANTHOCYANINLESS 2-like n=1 Tax=Lycium barbarum TaxID=112863 RepID=UPI00293F60D2|nr:homeobox-leucine zipper protein ANTHOCYANINLESS 2-like [Lycium barbarum]XP_060197330.1 homeobox-leucine zipper protein ANTHOCYANINLESS 2-like [Lycium barbarum]
MDSKQVKFWFQNRRTQMKSLSERCEKGTLKQENVKLRTEQNALKEAMRNPICDHCGYRCTIVDINIDEYQAKIEHDRLQDEVKRIKVLADKLLGSSAYLEGSTTSMMENSDLGFDAGRNAIGGINVVDTASPMGLNFGNDLSSCLPVISPRLTTSLVNEDVIYDKSMLMDLAFAAKNELLKLAENGEPLWLKSLDGGGETLNLEAYARSCTRFTLMKPGHFTTEATRAFGTVFSNSQTLVETLMNESQWVETFSCIVGKTSTIDVISGDIGGSRSGTLQLIQTEFQIISNLVPVRKIKFLRFCQQVGEGTWIVMDVSVDTMQEGSHQCEIENCRRLPSSCIVQDMLNGYCKVTWIEHMEYNENFIHHLYHPLVRIGLGFGAQRWMANLQRKSEFLAVMMSSVNTTSDHAVCSSGQKSIGKLVQRMTRSFCAGVCATIHKWETIQRANGEDAKLMMRKNIGDPGEPIGVVLSATKTIWLPMKQHLLFEFFMNEQTRSQWDVVPSSGPMQQMVHVFKGQNLDSSISLFHVNGDDISANQNSRLILQDACTDATGSLLVYATINSLAVNMVMNGGDSSCVALLPSGIAIVPDCYHDFSGAHSCNGVSGKKDNGFSCSGSLVTIGFQLLVNSSPAAKY